MKVATLTNNLDNIALYWKKMPFRTFIGREMSLLDFKASKGRLTLDRG
jgi:hypothetical protein